MQEPRYRLRHPVYLDVPMMISFLAHLEGGVSTSEAETKRESGAKERLLKGRAGARFRLPAFTSADASAEGAAQSREESTVESTSERHHTSASLFNLLLDYLHEDEELASLNTASDLENLVPGVLVEVSGEYLGNPLEDVLAFFNTLLPYLQEQQEAERAALETAKAKTTEKRGGKRSGNPAVRAAASSGEDAAQQVLELLEGTSTDPEHEFGVRMIMRMAEDLQRVPVHDLLMKTPSGVDAVLTVSSDHYTPATNEYLRAGMFTVVGKVTRVIESGESVNLARRTVLGAAGPELAQELIRDLANGEELQITKTDPVVDGPAVQILPMAIFI